MAQIKNDNILIRAPKPIDDRGGFWLNGSWKLFTSTAAALADPDVINYRFPSMTVPIYDGINPTVEYWFDGGVLDSDFKVKVPATDLSGLVPYVDAESDVDLGIWGIYAGVAEFSGSYAGGNTALISNTNAQGSGLYVRGGNTKATDSGGRMALEIESYASTDIAKFYADWVLNYVPVEATSFVKTGGTSSQFLKADGSVDATTYEPLANKQNSLAADGTNTKYPTVTAVNAGLATKVTTPDPLIPSVVLGTTLSTNVLGLVGYSQTPLGDQLAMYNFGGQLSTADPIDLTDAVNKQTLDSNLANYQLLSAKDQASGYAGLDSGAKILLSQLPDIILGQLKFGGTYNGVIIVASSNVPELNGQPLPAASSYEGVYFISTASYTNGGNNYETGDWIVSVGASWTKVDNTDAVSTVFGRTGAILAVEADYSAFYPLLSGSYVNPSWLTSLPFAKITGTPTTLSGYGITNAYTKTESDALYPLKAGTGATGTWGIDISGNAATATNSTNATNWGTVPSDFGASKETAPYGFFAYDNVTGNGGIYSPNAARLALGIPSGGETLQSVTDRGAVTTNSITVGNLFTGAQNGYLQFGTSVSSASYVAGDVDKLFLGINNDPKVTILNNGNLGIGTTTPASKLDVNGTVNSTGNITTLGNITVAKSLPLLVLTNNDVGGKSYSVSSGIQGVSNTGFSIRDESVGVNLLNIDGSNNTSFAASITATSATIPTITAGFSDLSLSGTDAITLRTGGTTRVTVDNGGRVGIGQVPNPIRASLLEVNGNVWSTDAYILGASNTPIGEFGLDGDVFVRTMSTQSLNFRINSNDTRMSINGSTGIVTIATPALTGIVEYVDNAAAIAGGLSTGTLYRTADILKIVH